MRARRRAFTLMELLVVVTVVAALAAMAYPVFQRVTAGGRAAACISNLRQLGLALNLYTSENDSTMPTLRAGRTLLSEDVPVIDNTLDRYTTNRGIFACPGDNRHLAAISGTSYYWNVALNGQSL